MSKVFLKDFLKSISTRFSEFDRQSFGQFLSDFNRTMRERKDEYEKGKERERVRETERERETKSKRMKRNKKSVV